MDKKKLTFVIIMVLAAVLRFYHLGNNPPSIDWDEASIGYNAYSLLKTGKDEFGNSWPISIRSFNDYKPPLYTYTVIPSIAIFGINEFAVRFPSALAGTLSVFVIYFLIKELFRKNNTKFEILNSKFLPETASLLLAISPWHLQFSRVAFEANLALFLFVLGTYFLLKALRNKSLLLFCSSAVAFIATMYSYHSARVVVPLFLLLFSLIYRKSLMKNKSKIFVAIILGVILLIPMGITFTRAYGQSRFTTVSVFTNRGIFTQEQEKIERQLLYRQEDQVNNSLTSLFHLPQTALTTLILEGYFDHFDLNFLFLKGDDMGRHSVVGMGLLYFWELPVILLGIYLLIKDKRPANKLIFSWFLVAPIASALTTHTPHAVRALLMLPPLIIFSSYGLVYLIKVASKRYLLLIPILFIVFGNLFYYLNLYHIHTPIERSVDWQYGYKQLVEKVSMIENNFEEIIITTDYDQPYIFFLFFQKTDPAWYQQFAENGSNGFGKYIFRKIEYRRDKELPNRLIVAVEKEIPDDAPVFDTIEFLNGQTAFFLIKS